MLPSFRLAHDVVCVTRGARALRAEPTKRASQPTKIFDERRETITHGAVRSVFGLLLLVGQEETTMV